MLHVKLFLGKAHKSTGCDRKVAKSLLFLHSYGAFLHFGIRLLLKAIYQVPDKDYKERMSDFISMFRHGRFLRHTGRMKGEAVAAFIHHAKILLLDEPTIGLGYRCEK